MKKRKTAVSRHIIYIPLVFIIVFILFGFTCLDYYFNKTSFKRYEKDLTRLAHSGAQMIELLDYEPELEDYDNLADAFAQSGQFRATIISISGMVLGDSRLSIKEVRQVESHADRPEVLVARDSGVGVSTRHSNTLNIDLLYVAVKYNNFGRKGYFRVALPLSDLKTELLHQRILFGGFFLVALIIAGTMSLLASRYLISLVEQGKVYLETRVNERTRQIEILQNIGTQLTACNTMEEVLKVLSSGVSILLPDYTGALALFRASKDRLEIVETWNGEWAEDKSYLPDQCWALRTGKPYASDSERGNVACSHIEKGQTNMICVPAVAQGVVHGVFHFQAKGSKVWLPAEQQLAYTVAEHASLTLASLDLKESLRQQAIRDPLTGLYNRRYLMETFDHEIARASRRDQNVGLLMIDLDHFKKFNDENGHDIGDFILSEFGRLLKKNIRQEDIPCRYGGEEFTVLLPEADRDSVFSIGEKIRMKIRECDFLYKNKFYGPVTISVGGAVYPQDGISIDHLFKKADDALYRAKHAGRDQVIVCE